MTGKGAHHTNRHIRQILNNFWKNEMLEGHEITLYHLVNLTQKRIPCADITGKRIGQIVKEFPDLEKADLYPGRIIGYRKIGGNYGMS